MAAKPGVRQGTKEDIRRRIILRALDPADPRDVTLRDPVFGLSTGGVTFTEAEVDGIINEVLSQIGYDKTSEDVIS